MPRHGHVAASGTLIDRPGAAVYLADLVGLSYPPTVVSGIEVRGIDVAAIPGASTHGGICWVDAATVSGTIDDGILVAEALIVAGVRVDLAST